MKKCQFKNKLQPGCNLKCFCPPFRTAQSHFTELDHSLIPPLCLNYSSSLEGAWLAFPALILLITDLEVFSLFGKVFDYKSQLTLRLFDGHQFERTHTVCCDCEMFLKVCPYTLLGHQAFLEFGMSCLSGLLWNVKIPNCIVNFNNQL